MQKIIIGIAGKMASGKGTVANALVLDYQADRVRSSKPLRLVLDQFLIPQKREHLQKLSTLLRQAFGEQTLIQSIVHQITLSTASLVVFDGIRRAIDVQTLKTLPNFLFIYVDAPSQIRYERYVKRNENPGDGAMTYEEFLKEDNAEPESEIEGLKELADHVIDSSVSYDQFHTDMRELFKKLPLESALK